MIRALLACLAALLLAGCSFPVLQTGYLDDYGSFNAVDERDVKVRLHTKEDFSLGKYLVTEERAKELEKEGLPVPDAAADGVNLSRGTPVVFVVEEPQWLAPPWKKEHEQEITFTLRERMYRYLLREYPHPVRVRYAYSAEDPLVRNHRMLVVESAVTHTTKGSGFLRYVIGYGAGAASLQYEGRIYEGLDKKKLVAEFAARESHAAYPQGFMNLAVWQASYTLKYAAEATIRDVSGALPGIIPGIVPKAQESE